MARSTLVSAKSTQVTPRSKTHQRSHFPQVALASFADPFVVAFSSYPSSPSFHAQGRFGGCRRPLGGGSPLVQQQHHCQSLRRLSGYLKGRRPSDQQPHCRLLEMGNIPALASHLFIHKHNQNSASARRLFLSYSSPAASLASKCTKCQSHPFSFSMTSTTSKAIISLFIVIRWICNNYHCHHFPLLLCKTPTCLGSTVDP